MSWLSASQMPWAWLTRVAARWRRPRRPRLRIFYAWVDGEPHRIDAETPSAALMEALKLARAGSTIQIIGERE